MQIAVGVPSEWHRRFQSGRPSLDFVHTGGAEEHSGWEIADSAESVALLLPTLVRAPQESIPVNSSDVESFRSLRSAITRCVIACFSTKPYSTQDTATITDAARNVPLTNELTPNGSTPLATPNVSQALSTLARDAIEILDENCRYRIHSCAADDCGLFFFDESRSNNRRWCSMQRCGNRAKIRQHRSG